MSYKFWTDSSCDLTADMLKELGVGCTSLDVIVNNDPPKANDQVEPHAFYESLRAGATAKTAAANRGTFIESFEPIVAAGEDLLYIGFSSGLSATFQAAKGAAEDLSEKYPDRKIYAVDSLAASMGEPPPIATIQSGSNFSIASAPRITVSTEGSGSMPSKTSTSMPASFR